jgi:hypothetical protein
MNEQDTTTAGSQRPWDFERVAHESVDIALQLGRELGRAAEDLTGLMLIHADKPLRTKLDMLVESGVVKSRYEALEMLIKFGEIQKNRIFDQIEKTRSEIEVLKKGLKGLVGS